MLIIITTDNDEQICNCFNCHRWIMCQIFVGATGLWTLLGNNHDLMIMQSWFDENAMKQLTFLTLDYICISRSGTPSRYTEIHFVNNCLSKKRNRPKKRPPNAKSSNANEVPPHSLSDSCWFIPFCLCWCFFIKLINLYYIKFQYFIFCYAVQQLLVYIVWHILRSNTILRLVACPVLNWCHFKPYDPTSH